RGQRARREHREDKDRDGSPHGAILAGDQGVFDLKILSVPPKRRLAAHPKQSTFSAQAGPIIIQRVGRVQNAICTPKMACCTRPTRSNASFLSPWFLCRFVLRPEPRRLPDQRGGGAVNFLV